jgi:hypothetical protein
VRHLFTEWSAAVVKQESLRGSASARAALATFHAGSHCVGEANDMQHSKTLAKRGTFRTIFYGVLTQRALKSLADQSISQADDEGSTPFTRSNFIDR